LLAAAGVLTIIRPLVIWFVRNYHRARLALGRV